jgi:hypothetical protein
MNPIVVDSTQCHLWTDALHVRQLARDSANRWDRGTYVRLCVVLSWTALEIACQEALRKTDIGYRFKENLNQAIADQGLPALNWSQGVWQDVRRLQELRKSYVHRFASLADMFPDSSVADDAITVVRTAIGCIFDHASLSRPAWINFDQSHGWAGRSGVSDSASATLVSAETSFDDPSAVRIFFVANGVEHLSSVHPRGFSYASEVESLVRAVQIPISAVRVYEGPTLARELLVCMRGNG